MTPPVFYGIKILTFPPSAKDLVTYGEEKKKDGVELWAGHKDFQHPLLCITLLLRRAKHAGTWIVQLYFV